MPLKPDITADLNLIQQLSVVPTILDVVCQTTGMGFAAVAKVTEDQWITCGVLDKIAFGLQPGDELPIKTTLCNEIRQYPKTIVIDHVDTDPHYCNHHTPALYKFQSYISVPIIRKNGEFFGTLCSIDPFPRELNNPKIINTFELYADLISLHMDIAEDNIRKETQLHEERLLHQEVTKNEAKLNVIIEASELGFWEIRVKERTIEFSDKFMAISGYSDRNALTLDEIVAQTHPDDKQARLEAYDKALETGDLYFIGRIIWPDSSIHWIESKGKTFFENNQPAYILGVTRDITAEKEAAEVLAKSETKFRLLADSMPQHVWLADPTGNLYYYNQYVYDFSGLTPEKIKEDGWLQIVHPDDRDENIRQWTESVTTGKEFVFEHRFRKHDGSYKWQLSRATPQVNDNGVIQMWVGTSADIQTQKELTVDLGQKIIEQGLKLHERNSEITKMAKELANLAYISNHDLQEPLRKIQTFAKMIVANEFENLSDKGRDYFRRIAQSAVRMQALIDDLMSYSRLTHEERIFEETDLNAILEEVKNDLKEELALKQAVITTNTLLTVPIVSFQIRQLFQNLISNSLKYAKSSEVPLIEIKNRIIQGNQLEGIGSTESLNFCHISFKDNGIGFDQAYSERIFELFQRLHDKNKYPGTGIGLAIAKKIVENHKGFIKAESVENEGTTFHIYLPL